MWRMEIERHIPIPPEREQRHYPFAVMQPGDSLFDPDPKTGRSLAGAIRVFAHKHRQAGWKAATRREGTGWRVWRVA